MRARLAPVGVMIVLLMTGCGPKAATQVPAVNPTARPTSVPAPTATALPTPPPPSPMPSPTAAPLLQPTNTSDAKPTPAPRIVLSEVSVQAQRPGVVHVAGRAQVFEAVVSLWLKDMSGSIIARGTARASEGAPGWGDFRIDLFFPPPAAQVRGSLEAFEASPKDGEPESLVSQPIVMHPAPDLTAWNDYTNSTFGFKAKYPPRWFVNQGTFGPPPPATTKLSTYEVSASGLHTLGSQDTEVWIGVSDAPSIAEMQNLEAQGYRKTDVSVGGWQSVRYTASSPHHGVYDVVYTLGGPREYRIHLSAATHAFDGIFELMLASFRVD